MQQCAAWKWNFHNVILLIHKISWTFEYEIQLHCHWGKNSSAYFCKLNVIYECLTRKNTEKEHMLEDSDLEKIFIFEQCWVSRHFVCKSLCYFTNVKNFRTKKIWTKNLVRAPTILYWKNVTHTGDADLLKPKPTHSEPRGDLYPAPPITSC